VRKLVEVWGCSSLDISPRPSRILSVNEVWTARGPIPGYGTPRARSLGECLGPGNPLGLGAEPLSASKSVKTTIEQRVGPS
jgi:hypothetical protein